MGDHCPKQFSRIVLYLFDIIIRLNIKDQFLLSKKAKQRRIIHDLTQKKFESLYLIPENVTNIRTAFHCSLLWSSSTSSDNIKQLLPNEKKTTTPEAYLDIFLLLFYFHFCFGIIIACWFFGTQ